MPRAACPAGPVNASGTEAAANVKNASGASVSGLSSRTPPRPTSRPRPRPICRPRQMRAEERLLATNDDGVRRVDDTLSAGCQGVHEVVLRFLLRRERQIVGAAHDKFCAGKIVTNRRLPGVNLKWSDPPPSLDSQTAPGRQLAAGPSAGLIVGTTTAATSVPFEEAGPCCRASFLPPWRPEREREHLGVRALGSGATGGERLVLEPDDLELWVLERRGRLLVGREKRHAGPLLGRQCVHLAEKGPPALVVAEQPQPVEDRRRVDEREQHRDRWTPEPVKRYRADRHLLEPFEPQRARDGQELEVEREPLDQESGMTSSATSRRKTLMPTWVSRTSSLKSARTSCW